MTALGESTPLASGEANAINWMAALREARQAAGDPGGLPPGASCNVAEDGTATVLDSMGRRRYELTPTGPGSGPPSAPPPAVSRTPAAASPAPVPARPSSASPASASPASAGPAAPGTTPSGKPRKETVAFSPEMVRELDAPRAPAVAPAASVKTAGSVRPAVTPSPSSSDSIKRPIELELLIERDQDPSEGNPLTYRERAYLLPPKGTVPEAEAALRWKLAELQQRLADVPMGKFANLAVFDHRWTDVPERPPVVALQWRDWRNEIDVDYPAAHVSKKSEKSAQPDERLTQAFEALHELSAFTAPADGLDFATSLLADLVPSEAISGCLYDINTDELRFVSLRGPGAEHMQGKAVPPNAGLLGEAIKAEERAIVFSNASGHEAFDITIDGRPGLEPREQLYRPVQHEGHLLGVLRLTNRRGGSFSREDAAVVDYVARRLAEFLNETRFQRRSRP